MLSLIFDLSVCGTTTYILQQGLGMFQSLWDTLLQGKLAASRTIGQFNAVAYRQEELSRYPLLLLYSLQDTWWLSFCAV